MDVTMPELGDAVAGGIVTRWHKKTGDAVERDEPLAEVETDKITVEVVAPAKGVLGEILVEEGAAVDVGARLAVILEGRPEA
jgi:2-oxoglutarate dehydrogenase E2 component (dihydrolipoamide succinyltransferase)